LQNDPSFPPVSETEELRILDKETGTPNLLDLVIKKSPIKEINIYSVDWRQHALFGRLLRYEKNAVIDINKDQNNCWRRYIATKELSHLIIDRSREHFTGNAEKLVEYLLGTSDVQLDASLDSEHLAARFAAEILMPYKYNYMLEDKSLSTYDIAEMFKMPRKIIDVMRSEKYQEQRKEAYKDIP
ncbi:MAG: Peptidase protein, partial [Campylobacterota bacterium]|nr:Peptidase protein [Campylobacterota bacterium]